MMTKTTATLELVETIGGHETIGTDVDVSTIPVPVVLASMQDIQAGSVLLRSDVPLPESVHFAFKLDRQWRILTEANGFDVERMLSDTGWHFFFMVPEIKTGALSFHRNQGLRKALRKLTFVVEAQKFNALEIVEINTKGFLGLNYVEVVAHPRHVKNSPFLRDLDPNYVPRTVWDFKGILRRRSQIGRMRKGI